MDGNDHHIGVGVGGFDELFHFGFIGCIGKLQFGAAVQHQAVGHFRKAQKSHFHAVHGDGVGFFHFFLVFVGAHIEAVRYGSHKVDGGFKPCRALIEGVVAGNVEHVKADLVEIRYTFRRRVEQRIAGRFLDGGGHGGFLIDKGDIGVFRHLGHAFIEGVKIIAAASGAFRSLGIELCVEQVIAGGHQSEAGKAAFLRQHFLGNHGIFLFRRGKARLGKGYKNAEGGNDQHRHHRDHDGLAFFLFFAAAQGFPLFLSVIFFFGRTVGFFIVFIKTVAFVGHRIKTSVKDVSYYSITIFLSDYNENSRCFFIRFLYNKNIAAVLSENIILM